MLSHDLLPYETVYKYWQKWRRRGIWQLIHDYLRDQLGAVNTFEGFDNYGEMNEQGKHEL